MGWCKENIELAKLIVNIIAMCGGVVALKFQCKRTKAMEQSVNINREDNIAQRFAKAIEHLGSEQNAIKLGGIHSLHQIAKDHPQTYSEQVADILCSYIRETYPASEDFKDDKPVDVIAQTILNVITSETFKTIRLDLNGANLNGARFTKANLVGAHLNWVNLNRARFTEASLVGANITDASLVGAQFMTSSLVGTNLTKSNLMKVVFVLTDLSDAKFNITNLSGTRFMDVLNIDKTRGIPDDIVKSYKR